MEQRTEFYFTVLVVFLASLVSILLCMVLGMSVPRVSQKISFHRTVSRVEISLTANSYIFP